MNYSKNAVGSGRYMLLAGAGVAAIALAASPALAQDGDDEDEATVTGSAADTDADAPAATPQPSSGGIVVTGSRIRRDEFSSASPITIVDPEISARQGLNSTSAMVQGSPIAAGSDQITAALGTSFLVNGGTGAETVSLRGLGAERTLVLLNGRRAGPSGTRGGVSSFDLNVLPQAIVGQVDILKDGASSIYGSDAVAGVVNLITKRDTDGIEIDMFGSVPFESGGEERSISATWGKTFDRGHILVSAGYSRRNELARGDRDYLGCGEVYFFTDLTYSTRADLIDPRTGEFACGGSDSNNTWGHVWTYDYSYTDATGDGFANLGAPGGSNIPGSPGDGTVQLLQFSYGNDNLGAYIPPVGDKTLAGQIGVPTGWFNVAYDPASNAVTNRYHPLMDNDTVIPETNLYTAYLDASYELTDGIEFYTELLYNRRDNFVNASGQIYQFGLGEVYDYYYDYTDGDGLQTTDPSGGFAFDPYAAGWTGPAVFSPTPFNPHIDSSVKVDYYRAVAGFRGDITSNWTYDVYGQWSRSDGTYRNQTALKDAIACANFRSGTKGYSERRCPGGVAPVSGRQNVIVDWFSPRFNFGDYTPEEFDFLFAWDVGETRYTQKYVEAIVTGDLIELPWSGPVGIAVGGTIREDEINDVPGPIRQADNGFNFGGAGVTAGKSVTKELFAEVDIPLLRDIPLIQALDFSGAARVTNVKATRASDGFSDSTNGNWTYKLGLNWEVNDWIRFRGTYGTSYRAPALFEQFLADQTGFLAQRSVDPCTNLAVNLAAGAISQRLFDNCVADGVDTAHTGTGVSLATLSGGGVGVLDPETSKAWTVSAVLTPQLGFLPDTDISIAVDYFDIEVNGEIARLGAASILSQCYNSDFFPNDPLCGQFFRFSDFDDGSAPADVATQYDQPGGDRDNIAVVFDQFFNINSQRNKGVDVTARIVHDFGNDTRLTLQGQMSWQTRDDIALFDGFNEDNNGEAGEPKWVGDFFASLDKGPWTLHYGLDVIGKTDDRQDYLDANGTLCPTFTTFPGPVCLKLTTSAQFYHSLSVTREIGDNFRMTVGVRNITDNAPPRTSQSGGDGTRSVGQGLLYSQYDLRGRRAFVNFNFKY